MRGIKITEDCIIYNDMPIGWINKRPRYKTHKGYKWYKVNHRHNLKLRRVH